MAKLRRRQTLSNGELSKQINSLSLIGASPADRAKISVGPTDDSPFNEFAQFLT